MPAAAAAVQGMAERKLRRRVTELEMVDELEPIAEELGATLAQLALAWCLKNKNVSVTGSGAFPPLKALWVPEHDSESLGLALDVSSETPPEVSLGQALSQ